jgi:hypothetical protein
VLGRHLSRLENLPTYRAVLTIPAGLDETRLAVVDDTSVIAETTWRPAENYQTGTRNLGLAAASALRSHGAVATRRVRVRRNV